MQNVNLSLVPDHVDDYDPTDEFLTVIERPVKAVVDPQMQRDIEARVRAMQIDSEARKIIAEAAVADAPPMDVGTLAEMLMRDEQMSWRIGDLLPAEGRMTIIAKRKTGKTTLSMNLVKCLITGDEFLGQFPVNPIPQDCTVALMNYEVSGFQLAQWAKDHDVDPDRFVLINLRGKRNPLSSDDGREELVKVLREHNVSVLIVDPFGRAFNGDQNSASEVAPWLVELDTIANDAGVSELILNVHAGIDGSRSRGSSALEDWPDTFLTLTEDDGKRYIKARGRDVEIEKSEIAYDPETRQITIGDNRDKQTEKATGLLEEFIAIKGEVTKTEIDEWARTNGTVSRSAGLTAKDRLIESGTIATKKREGRGGGTLYYLK